jgi:hypothetical protein
VLFIESAGVWRGFSLIAGGISVDAPRWSDGLSSERAASLPFLDKKFVSFDFRSVSESTFTRSLVLLISRRSTFDILSESV